MEYDVELSIGLEIECSPIEMSYFISAILAVGGSFTIYGSVLVVDSLPNQASEALPVAIAKELPNISPDQTIYETYLASVADTLVTVEVEVESETSTVAVELPPPTKTEEVEVAEGSSDLSPAEDLADTEEVVKQSEEPEMNTPELDDDADRIVAEFTKPAPTQKPRGRQPKVAPVAQNKVS